MQKSIVVVFILFVSFYQCDAQLIIKGKLMDATGEPLPYANITMKNFGSCSNDNGLFEFKLPDVSSPVSIKISSVGYETKIMKIQPVSPEVDLGLILVNRKVVELDEVTIRAKTTDAENRIKVLKENFGTEGFCMDGFCATETAMRFVMVAYNLSLFRLITHQKQPQPKLSTLRFNCFAVGSWVEQEAQKGVLKMSVPFKRRQGYDGLF